MIFYLCNEFEVIPPLKKILILLFSADTTDSISTNRTKVGASKAISSIHKHTRLVTEEDKNRTKKKYFCKYCPPEDPQGYYTSTDGLRRHLLTKHEVIWTRTENESRTTPRDAGDSSVQTLYEKLLEKGEAQGLEGEVLRHTAEKGAIKQTLIDLIIVRRLPFSCVEWPEFHAFIKVLNREADTPDIIPIHHSTVTEWIHNHFSESQDILRRVLQSAKTNIHLAVDIWTSPNHSLILGICASFLNIHDQYHNVLIGLRTVHSQSGEDQWNALQPVIESYGIETKIGALVGDNAGSNDVLCRIISTWLWLEHKISWNAEHQRIRCQGHVINLIVQAFLFITKKNEKLMASYDKDEEQGDEEEEEEEAEEENQEGGTEESEEDSVRQAKTLKPVRGRGKARKKVSEPEKEVGQQAKTLPTTKTKTNREPLSTKGKLDEKRRNIRDIMGPMGKLHDNVVHIRFSANRTTWFKGKAGKIIPLDIVPDGIAGLICCPWL